MEVNKKATCPLIQISYQRACAVYGNTGYAWHMADNDTELKMARLLRERAHLRARIRDIESVLIEYAWKVLDADGTAEAEVGRFILRCKAASADGEVDTYLAEPSLRRWTTEEKEAFVFVSKADAEANIGPSTAIVVRAPA